MSERLAYAKINLALVVGPSRPDGKHEVTTVLQRIGLADRIELEPHGRLSSSRASRTTRSSAARSSCSRARPGSSPYWRAVIDKQIPVAAGLGGGSSDAAAALELANETLGRPVADARLHQLAADLGADVPFFLARGPQLGEGDGTVLTALELPQAFTVLVLIPEAESRSLHRRRLRERSTTAAGRPATRRRRGRLLEALAAGDLAALPPNDLARRRTRRSCAGSAPSGPTSAGPGRPSTGCSQTCRPPRLRSARSRGSGASGSGRQRGRLGA